MTLFKFLAAAAGIILAVIAMVAFVGWVAQIVPALTIILLAVLVGCLVVVLVSSKAV